MRAVEGRAPVVFAYFRVPGGWRQVVRSTLHEFGDDDCAGLAAQLAFYFLLSLFPAMLFLVALAGYVPVEGLLPQIVGALSTVAPLELVTLIRGEIEQVSAANHSGLLTLGMLGALWSSSAASVAIIDALNQAYDIEDRRPWWRRRLVAVLLTVALAALAVFDITLILAGPSVVAAAAGFFDVPLPVAGVWSLLRWPLLLGLAIIGVDLVYYFAPNRRAASWVWVTPGALLGTALWIGSSFGFKFYVTNVADYGATYGTITGVIVTMLWFYVSGLAILIGAELNAVIEVAQQRAGMPS